MMQTRNRTGVEPVNGTVFSWRDMALLMDPHNKTTKDTHTHTHTHTHTQDLLPEQTILGASAASFGVSPSWAA